MPNEVIDMLAGLSVERAVFLALMVCGASVVPFFLLVNVERFVPQRLRDARLPERATEIVRTAVDHGRDRAVTVLLAIVRHLDPKGTGR